jgi:hypothetical protein
MRQRQARDPVRPLSPVRATNSLKKPPVCSGFFKPSDGLEPSTPLTMRWSHRTLHLLGTASVVQASGFRSDVTVFRLNAACARDFGLELAFRRNTAARVYAIEAAHNPEVAGSNPAPATAKGPGNGAFLSLARAPWPCSCKPLSSIDRVVTVPLDGAVTSRFRLAIRVCTTRMTA